LTTDGNTDVGSEIGETIIDKSFDTISLVSAGAKINTPPGVAVTALDDKLASITAAKQVMAPGNDATDVLPKLPVVIPVVIASNPADTTTS
jgi:hypothetical protein